MVALVGGLHSGSEGYATNSSKAEMVSSSDE